MGTCQGVQCCTPDEVNSDTEEKQCCSKCFIKCRVKRKIEPKEEKSKILIQHNKDGPDPFGAYLSTFKESRKDGSDCFIHILEDVDTGEPAGEMGIINKDELVLVNDAFVQEMTHGEVMDLFRNVKVDGKTQLKLVLLRNQEWIKSDAVLDRVHEVDLVRARGADVVVPLRAVVSSSSSADNSKWHLVAKQKDVHVVPVTEKIEGRKTKHRYKVPGTQQYLDISKKGISFGTINTKINSDCDKTTIFWKSVRYWQDNDYKKQIDFEVALSDETMKRYIGIDDEMVVLKDNPFWFRMTKTTDTSYHFQSKEKCLGYEYFVNNQVEVKALLKHGFGVMSNCEFEQTPPDCPRERERQDTLLS